MEAAGGADLHLLVAAARAAGDLALRYHGRSIETWQKHGGSVVSEADMAVDRLLSTTLRKARPDYGWRSEEEAEPSLPGVGNAFIVDPIDGTRDFLAGGREWTVSLAIVQGGRPQTAVLFAPVLGELYTAECGAGAACNGLAIRAASPAGLAGARFAGPRRFARPALEAAGVPAKSLRFVPSLAYRLALVAAGIVDVAIAGPGSHDWDLAAADLLVHEAGATLTDLAGRTQDYALADDSHPALIAASPPLSAEVRALIAGSEIRPDGKVP